MTEWEVLCEGLDRVFRRERMTVEQYFDLYTTVYDYCNTQMTVSAHLNSEDDHLANNAYGGLFEFYNKLRDYIGNVTVRIYEKGAELRDEDLLKYFNTEYENFRLSASVANTILEYFNRHFIKRALRNGYTSIYMIYPLCLIQFQQHVLRPLETKIMDTVLDLIREERKGNPTNTLLVSGFIDCLLEIGREVEREDDYTVDPMESPKLNEYKTTFQQKFIESTYEFYKQEAAVFAFGGASVTDYMLKVEKTFEEENHRLSLYLNNCTREPLIKCCEKALISDHLDFFAFNFGQMFADERDDDLMRMYGMCSRVPDGLNRLRAALNQQICKEGREVVERVAELAINDPKLYVKTLLEVHQKYRQRGERSFNNDPGFMQSLDRAIAGFVNVNAVVNKAPSGMHMAKTAGLLARYCDQLLRKSSRMPDETEMENLLTEAMIVFKYLEDKDVFSKLYAKLFSNRLINEVSASEEAEASFINKMKTMCGFEYTKRLMKMVSDMQVSKELSAEFKEMVTERIEGKSIDLNVMVLTKGSWPSFPICDLKLPRQLSRKIEEFGSFYNAKYNARRLSWIYSQSRGEVTSFAFKKKYVFTVTTAQMCILLLFNEQDSYTGQQISEATGMDEKTTLSVVGSLTNSHVLKPSVGIEEVSLTASLMLNEHYHNKHVRVDLSRNAMKSDVVKESINFQKSVEEDRRNIINAAIVRIMKTHKSIQHEKLISEVTEQLSERFKPNVEMIKRCIESLIEKEYLKRDSQQKDFYEYIV